MSIVSKKYQTDQGTVIKIRLDSAKAAITGNTEPAGAITDTQLQASVSHIGNRRRLGVQARGVYFSRVGTGTDLNKVFRVFIPAFTQASQTTIAGTTSITYKGNTFTNPVAVGEA
jgi:hypothetical protein